MLGSGLADEKLDSGHCAREWRGVVGSVIGQWTLANAGSKATVHCGIGGRVRVSATGHCGEGVKVKVLAQWILATVPGVGVGGAMPLLQ